MILRTVIALEDTKMLRHLAESLAAPNVVVDCIRPTRRAWDQIIRKGGDVIVVSHSLVPPPFERSIAQLNRLPELPTTVVMTESDSAEEHANMLAAGCDTILYSGLPIQQLILAIEPTIQSRRQLTQGAGLSVQAGPRPKLSDFVSESPAMQMFMLMVRRVTSSDSALLILGETGVGKEHLARAMHAESPRSFGPFVAINCAALPEQLLESELFGHEEGAFTGATRNRRGAFEMAHSGTLFLDEIGEMPLHLQAKLLRVLQDLEVRRVGGETTVRVDVRVMAASNRDLEAEVAEHRFRRDLYFRLSVVELVVPPLSERRIDIPAMAQQFITRIAPRIGVDIRELSEEALEALCRYDWPGNVRELANVLERALLLCEGDEITPGDLPTNITGAPAPVAAPSPAGPQSYSPLPWREKTLPEVRQEEIDRIERSYISMVLAETGGRVGQAAQRAGIHPRGLYDKMRKLGLRKEDFRRG